MTLFFSGSISKKGVLFVSLLLFALVGCGQKSEIATSPAGKPKVVLVNPGDRTTSFSKDNLSNPSPIFAIFNKDMDPTSVRSGITLNTMCNQGVPLLPGSPAYDIKSRTVTIKPGRLEANQQYRVTIDRNALDTEGNSLESSTTWRFSTGLSIDNFPPTFDGISGVLVNSSTEVTLQWLAAEDRIDRATAQEELEYLIYRGQTASVGDTCQLNLINVSASLAKVSASDACDGTHCSFKLGDLDAATNYCFLVRARDRGCHLDGNQRIAHAVTNPGGKLYVANLGVNSLDVFDNAGQADKTIPRVIESSQTGLLRPIGMVIANHSGGKTLYAANFNRNSIVAYDWNPSDGSMPDGDVAPSRIFEGSLISLNGPVGMAIMKDGNDPTGDKDDLYVTNYNSGIIAVFPDVKSFDPAASTLKKIQIVSKPEDNEPFRGPIGIALDAAHDRMYVIYKDTNNIAIIDGISGKISGQVSSMQLPPDSKISRNGLAEDLTQINRPSWILLDVDRDRLYVANRGKENDDDNARDDAILVFDQVSVRTASDGTPISPNRSPKWIIKSSDLYEPMMLSMVSYQASDLSMKKRLYIVSSGDTLSFRSRVLVLDDIDSLLSLTNTQCSDSTTPPTCTLVPNLVIMGDHTQFISPSGVAVESLNGQDTVYVANSGSVNIFENLTVPSSPVPNPMDSKPDKMIAPSIYGPTGVVVDTTRETLYLASYYGDSISVFQEINNTDTIGNIRPTYRIFGKSTELSGPFGLTLVKASVGDRLYVANLLGNSILEFDLTQCTGAGDCNVAPSSICSLSDPSDPLKNTCFLDDSTIKLLSPIGITVDARQTDDPGDDLFYVSYRDQKFNDKKGDSIVVFKSDTNGALTPLRRIKSLNSPLTGPVGMYLDTFRQKLYVANRQADQILVFNVDEQEFLLPTVCSTDILPLCNLSPVQVIDTHQHSNNPFDPFVPGLHQPSGVFLDRRSNPSKLYVTGQGVENDIFQTEDAVLVYNNAETVSGAIIPNRIMGPYTGFTIINPASLFLDPDR